MKSSIHKAVLGGAAVFALSIGVSVGSTVWALESGGPGVDKAQGGGWRHGGGDPAGKAERLRALLQLTPAQEPALQAFLAASHRPHEQRAGGAGHAPGGPPGDPTAHKAEFKARREEFEKKRAEEAALSTPQRLDLMVRRIEERSAKRKTEFEARVAAVKQFYAALTPSQQKAFDALHGGLSDERGGHGGWGHGGRGWGRMGMGPGEPPAPLAMGEPPPSPMAQ